METRSIIAGTITSEGTSYPVEKLKRAVLERYDRGEYEVFRYGDTVFLVGNQNGFRTVHLHSMGVGPSILKHSRSFCHDVWERVDSDQIYAPIMNPKVAVLAKRFGWKPVCAYTKYHTLYMLERKDYVAPR